MENLWTGQYFLLCVHSDIDIKDVSLGKDHEVQLGHTQQLCDFTSKFNLPVKRYSPDENFNFVCTEFFSLKAGPLQ